MRKGVFEAREYVEVEDDKYGFDGFIIVHETDKALLTLGVRYKDIVRGEKWVPKSAITEVERRTVYVHVWDSERMGRGSERKVLEEDEVRRIKAFKQLEAVKKVAPGGAEGLTIDEVMKGVELE